MSVHLFSLFHLRLIPLSSASGNVSYFIFSELLVKLSLKQGNLPRTPGLKFANRSTSMSDFPSLIPKPAHGLLVSLFVNIVVT